ncbi:hypothetical protein M514_27404 [Trichuris suis]|uniref:Uncharacterized protein n=1 Tax=Trichuris suis TaxID=68888 RepID=A0A085MT65_9BILA|nr:hypothetical protein M514_27404 [Trichuris suis]
MNSHSPNKLLHAIQSSSLNVVLFANRKEFEGKHGSIRFIECSKFSCAVSIQDELLIVFSIFFKGSNDIWLSILRGRSRTG